ncbi:MAG: T9SS type A sorting domain-containing protein [Polaribacter sp.]|uniref:galactose-binding domain-containing protein n=1 Tax=Polaribacter sp. TaxID=1920175 RepID=UPI002F35F483
MKKVTYKNILFVSIFAFFVSFNTSAQSISGVVNTYKTVSTINGVNISLGDAAGLAVDDPIMIIQMTGISGGGNTGGTDNGAGNFHIAKITGVFGSGITIDKPVVKTFSPATEKVQLVKIARYVADVTVAATVSAQPWDGSTGGVVFIDACENNITLNANISATGTGFFGRNSNGNETSTACGQAQAFLDTPEENWGTNPAYYGNNYPNFVANSGGTGRGGHGGCDSTQGSPDGGAGVGGDGANSTSATLSSGGGGGGYGGGGTGGGNGTAVSGFAATPVVNIFDTANNLRFFMGATGGSEAEWAPATGNGGGIVIVLADNITTGGANRNILSDGDAGPNTGTFTWFGNTERVTGGAGGAGYIAIKANTINSAVRAFARGGTATIQNNGIAPTYIEYGGPGGGGFIISTVAITTKSVAKGIITAGNGAKGGADGKIVVDANIGTVLSLLCAGDACDAVATGNPDRDNDGISDTCDLDNDNDGILDTIESSGNDPYGDEDGDGTLNYLDNDDNGNGGPGGTTIYTDSNGDGIPDVYDTDGDGVPNHLDLDSDNDGLTDVIESGGQDINRDGLADGASGATGVPSSAGAGATPTSSDGDSLPNYLDIDSDNDGIPDNIEGQPTSGYIPPSGQSNTIIDANNNGVDDSFEFSGIIGFVPTNTDGTDNPDYLDADSDNDGILDIVENGDTDNALSGLDTDGDGLDNNFDDNNDSAIQGATVNDGINPPNDVNLGDTDNDFALGGDVDYRDNAAIIDTDNDGIPDSVDIDDDNDGILDTEEGCTPATGTFTNNLSFTTVSGSGFSYSSNNITFASGSDDYVNSTHSPIFSTYGVTNDFELDFTLNGTYTNENQRGVYIGINEAGTNSAINQSDIDYAFFVRGSGESLQIRENNVLRATVSSGANNNILTIRKVGAQITYLVNGALVYTSGVAANGSDYFVDNSFRGQSISFSLNNFNIEYSTVIDDLDGDGIPNCLDLDADNDGIPDNIEAQSTTGYVAPSGVDSDNDGLDDAYDTTPNGNSDGTGSLGLTPQNTDGTDNADYKDLDSDNDGTFDILESSATPPANSGGTVTGAVGTNGLVNTLDNGDNYVDVNGSFDATQTDNFPDADGDIGTGGDVDYRDIPGLDTDNDGVLDVNDLDDDNDGILDTVEGICNLTNVTPTVVGGLGSYTVTEDGQITISLNGGDGGGGNSTAGGEGATITNAVFNVFNGDVIRFVVGEGSDAGTTSAGGAGSTGVFINNILIAVAGGGGGGDNSGGGAIGFGANSGTAGDNGNGNANTFGIGGINGAGATAGTAGTSDAASGGGINSAGANGVNGIGGGAADLVASNGLTFITGGTPGTNASGGGGGFTAGGGGGSNYSGGGAGYSGGGAAGAGGSAGGGGSFLNTIDPNYVSGTITAGANGGGGASGANGVDGFVTINICIISDTDGDGIPNHLDLDSDNDGIPDVIESGGTDADRDGRADGVVGTSGGALGVPSSTTGGTGNTPTNSDGDSIPNYLDIDADNDGIPDNIEGQTTAGWVAPSGIATAMTDVNNNGVDDNYETGALVGLNPTNTDNTDNPDYIDTDSDNDGITDITENGDAVNNTIVDVNADADGDGLNDIFDDNDDSGITGFTVNDNHNPPAPVNLGDEDNDFPFGGNVDYRDIFGEIDTDNDGIPDSVDLDDDNDGILDTVECNTVISTFTGGTATQSSSLNNGNCPGSSCTANLARDGNTNGVFTNGSVAHTISEANPFWILDMGVDNIIDNVVIYNRTDCCIDRLDNFVLEVLDASDLVVYTHTNAAAAAAINTINGISTSGRKIRIRLVGTRFLGLAEVVVQTSTACSDTDGDGIPNNLDIDSDNDGIPDVIESGGTDADRDGRADGVVGTTVSTNGIPSSAGTGNTPTNSDFDTIPDYLDIDADNDGIPDNIEGQPSKTYVAPSGVGTGITDANNNGLDDNYETGGFVGINPENTDGTDNPDYTDLDSDNDFIDDIAENGNVNNVTSGVDTDGDGLDDNFDDNDDSGIAGATVNDDHTTPAPGNLGDVDNDFSSIGDLDYRDTGANGIPMITQVYQFGTEKWIEVTNISTSASVNPNLINIQLYKDKVGDQSGETPYINLTVAETLAPGKSVLFKNSANAITNLDSSAKVVENNNLTDLAGGDDIITLSSKTNSDSYGSRYDVVTGVTDKTSYVRIDETLQANTTYTASEWVVFVDDALDPYKDVLYDGGGVLVLGSGPERHPHDPLISEITGSNVDANTHLGLHRINKTITTGGAWDNGYPDRSRHVQVDGDYDHDFSSARLSARKLSVNNNSKLAITNSLLVVTNDIAITAAGDEVRLVGTSQLVQTHTGATQVSGVGKLLVDQNSTVPSIYRYNYMSSPVNTIGLNTYSLETVFKDGTIPLDAIKPIGNLAGATNIAKDILFVGDYDGDTTDPITLAEHWVYTYSPSSDNRSNWLHKYRGLPIKQTDGFIFKGPGRLQNYTFMGTPKDGELISSPSIGGDESYLVGNPFSSSMSVKKFIEDNMNSTTATLYFWEHVGEVDDTGASSGHNYTGYIGGYATRNIAMGLSANDTSNVDAFDITLEAEEATIAGDIIANDGEDVVVLDSQTDFVEFKRIVKGVDVLTINYKSVAPEKEITLEIDGEEKGVFPLPYSATYTSLDITLCVERGSNVKIVSKDTNIVYINHLQLADADGNISCSPTGGGSSASTVPGDYIAIGQGFFIEGDSDGGPIVFNNSQREFKKENEGAVFFRGNTSQKSASNQTQSSSNALPIIKLGMDFINEEDNSIHRQLGISFNPNNSFAYDKGYDSEIYDLGLTDVYWKLSADDLNYVIAGVQEISDDLEIPFTIIMDYDGSVSFQIDEIKNINREVFIKDSFTDQTYLLNDATVALQLTKGTHAERFLMVFKQGSVLSDDDTINEALNNEVSIYMDASSKELVIQNHGNLEINKVVLFNILGQKVNQWKDLENIQENRLKTTNLSNHVYIVNLQTDKGKISKKVIIE